MRAKGDREILDDATLVTYHSFDNSGSYRDQSSLKLPVTTFNVTPVDGRVNQAIGFPSNASYYQVREIEMIGQTLD